MVSKSRPRPPLPLIGVTAVLVSVLIAGCSGRRYDPTQATRPYPIDRPPTQMLEIQALRSGGDLILVNASPFAFENVDIWVNQRYMLHLDRLDVGETRTTWFGNYFDQWGETPVAGGFFRTEIPTPAVLVEFEIDREGPLFGAVAILDQGTY